MSTLTHRLEYLHCRCVRHPFLLFYSICHNRKNILRDNLTNERSDWIHSILFQWKIQFFLKHFHYCQRCWNNLALKYIGRKWRTIVVQKYIVKLANTHAYTGGEENIDLQGITVFLWRNVRNYILIAYEPLFWLLWVNSRGILSLRMKRIDFQLEYRIQRTNRWSTTLFPSILNSNNESEDWEDDTE